MVSKQKEWTKFARALACAMALGLAAGCASTQTERSASEYTSDKLTTARVTTAILTNPNLKVAQIDVETFRGIVQLAGFVDNAQMIQTAGEVARSVEGVRSVRNDLRVRPAPRP